MSLIFLKAAMWHYSDKAQSTEHKAQIKHKPQTSESTNVLVSLFCILGFYLCFVNSVRSVF